MTTLPSRLALFLFVLLRAAALAAPPPQAQAAALLEQVWRSSGAPGVSAAVALRGKLVFAQGLGYADLENLVPATSSTVYNIGSISKVNTAVAVLKLLEQGKVGLDDPIQKYVPAFPDKGSPITLRHLLTHTSGIRHYLPTDFDSQEENTRPVATFDEAIQVFKNDPLLFPPGQSYFYSSYAVNLLQGVVEKASGRPFEDYLRQHVWGPAGMLATGFDVPSRIVSRRARGYELAKSGVRNAAYGDLSYKFASGGMLSTAEDLVRLGVALNHGELLKPETLALMYKPHLDPVLRFQKTGPPEKEDFQQGLLWRINHDAAGRRFLYHCGTVKGFQSCLVNYVEEDLVVAILLNAEVGGGWRDNLALADLFRSAAAKP